MSLAKRKDGRYIVKFKDRDGRWKQRSFRSDEEARQFDAECQYDEVENSRLTLLECVLAYLKNHQYCQRTIEIYEYIVCGHDRKNGNHTEGPAEILASRYVDTLTRMDLETVRENIRRTNAAITTANLYVNKLNAAMNWCVEQDLITENPWAKYRNIPGGKKKPRSGTLEDFSKLFPMLPPWMQWASKTAIALCLRPGISELFSLEWSAFDWKTQTVKVYMKKVDSTKLVYPPEQYMQEAWSRFQQDTKKGYSLVCRNRQERKVNPNSYYGIWRNSCKKAGVSMPMYALRHIAASQMLAGGADLAAVAAQLGHKNISTTASFYLHALTEAQRRASHFLPDCTKLVQNGAGFIPNIKA